MMMKRVSEPTPVQVYLGSEARERLERLAKQLDSTKSEILRRGIEALERQLTDPATHPALRLIGIVAEPAKTTDGSDVARDHDRLLADAEEATWG